MPTPAATGSLTIPKTCGRLASRLAPATAWRLGVDRVMTSSSSPPTIARAIVYDVAASPSALYRRTRRVRPSRYPDSANPASTPWTPSSMVACETCWNTATERILPRDAGPVAADPVPSRGRCRSVSSNTADAPRIKDRASHSRRRLFIIQQPVLKGPTPCGGSGTSCATTPVGSRLRFDINRASMSTLKITGGVPGLLNKGR